ncbi:uncharacterized protein LOC121367661 [Gigantopelta aegis]|uniref:uncharacterized protein LOC121367661 n=1 Tax=Gigantopelta aegis TaxID=1735272 RepID=UPI001B88C5B3|nr:uncharacterized protein LOC121367661 [Gigantopelta aegis]XP_041347901.1 uncharacterized protein LOC121367661 [Gigantopelta aegis]
MEEIQTSSQSMMLISEKEREYLAKLCWLLQDAGTQALRTTFNSIHPPLSLNEHLSHYNIKAVLTKLMDARVIDQRHWNLMYPKKNRPTSSQLYDAKLTLILLETICHLSAPYPGGWQSNPLQTDTSMSADLVRLQKLLQQIGSLSGVRHDEYPVLWDQIVEVLERLGGQDVKVQIETIQGEVVPEDQLDHYIQQLKDNWSYVKEKNIRRLRRLYGRGGMAKLSSIAVRRDPRVKHEKEGLSLEDKEVLTTMTKLLAEQVIAEDILDRLQQGQIIKIGDRHEIMALTKNSDRMHMVLDKIQTSKSTHGLKILCDALKFNHPAIYDTVMDYRKTVYKQGVKEVVDLVKVCQTAMCNQYRTVFSAFYPIPWNDNFSVNVYDYYVSLDVFDEHGQKQDLRDILPMQKAAGVGKRILIEGCSGSGKSTLAAVLASMWANNKNYFKHSYDFLLFIDAQRVSDDFSREVYHMVVPDRTPITGQEFWSVLEANARNVVILVDGYDDRTNCEKLHQILRGKRLRKSSVILFVTPEMHVDRHISPDYKLFNTGLGTNGRLEYMKSYAHLLKLTKENVEVLKEYLSKKEWHLLPHLSSPFVCFMLIMVYHSNTELDLLTVTTLSALCEQYCIVVAKQCCKRQNLEYQNNNFPDEVNEAIRTLGSLAFNAVVSGKVSFSEADFSQYSFNVLITKCGAMTRNNMTFEYRFLCTMFMDFLAAQHIEGMMHADVVRMISENNFLDKSRYAQLVSFVCGLYEEEPGVPLMDMVLQELAEDGAVNEIMWDEIEKAEREEEQTVESEVNGVEHNGVERNGVEPIEEEPDEIETQEAEIAQRETNEEETQEAESKEEETKEAESKEEETKEAETQEAETQKAETQEAETQKAETDEAETQKAETNEAGTQEEETNEAETQEAEITEETTQDVDNMSETCPEPSSAHILNYSHRLHGVAECYERPNAAANLAKSMSSRLLIRRKGLFHHNCILGLSCVLESEYCHVTHIDINLLPVYLHQDDIYTKLANALGKNSSLQHLKIYWWSLDIMAKFLRTVMRDGKALESLQLEDCTNHALNDISSMTWSALQDICANSKNVKRFVFNNCQTTAVVCHIIIHLPCIVEELDFSKCLFNLMCSSAIASKLECSKMFRRLVLSGTKIQSSDFSALAQGIKRSISLQELDLSSTELDHVGITAVAESIKLNSTLTTLDLSRCQLDAFMCSKLADALQYSRSMNTLVLIDSDVSSRGIRSLLDVANSKKKGLQLVRS